MLNQLLHKLQYVLKTDVHYLLKGGFWVSTSFVIQVTSGLILTIALANWLSKEALGTYQYILALAGIISVFTLSGTGKAITRSVAKGDEGAFRQSVGVVLKWNMLIAATSTSIALYYFLNGNIELGVSFLIVAIFAPIIEAFKLYQSYLQGKEAFRDGVMLGAWRKPLPLVAMIIGLYFTDTVAYLIFIYFFTNAISNVWVYNLVIKKYHPPKTAQSDLLSYSKHLSILAIVGRLAAQADKIILWQFVGPAAVAAFTIAQLATKYSGGAISAVTAVTLPKLAKRDLGTLQQTLPRKVFFFTVLMAVGALLYMLAIPPLFNLIFPDYDESILVAQLLGLSLIFLPRSIYAKALLAHEKIRYQYYLGVVIPIVSIGVMLILIPTHGILGAAYAALLNECILALTSYYLFKKAQSVDPS
jgi:O-antigen/teichoic acid export membrane protein